MSRHRNFRGNDFNDYDDRYYDEEYYDEGGEGYENEEYGGGDKYNDYAPPSAKTPISGKMSGSAKKKMKKQKAQEPAPTTPSKPTNIPKSATTSKLPNDTTTTPSKTTVTTTPTKSTGGPLVKSISLTDEKKNEWNK